jgi:3-oxoadipate enol-lactonase
MADAIYDDDFERGQRNRRAMLGDAWVDKSLANATAFNAEFQQLITRYAWHEIWGRPGLDPKTRRVIVLATTIALGRWEEYELHLRAALAAPPSTRLTPDEVKEVLMQAAIYAGVPAANTAFSHAIKVLRELGFELPAADAAQAAHPGVGRAARTTSRPHLFYTVREPRSGRPPRHTVVLSHALGCDSSMWDALANTLALDQRVICYDHRGHGRSESPPGPYEMAELADDAARLIDEAGGEPVVWIGLSMGGMVGQELALRHPSRVRALVIANSTSSYPADGRALWQQRIDTVRERGLPAIADMVMQRYFHEAFRTAHPAVVAAFRRRLLTTDPAGYIGCCWAISKIDTTDRLPQLRLPVLVIAGELDVGAPVVMSQTIALRVPGAQLVVLKDASHLSAIEQPEAFAATVGAFLARV